MKKSIPLLMFIMVCCLGHTIAQRVVDPVFTVGDTGYGSANFKGAVVDNNAFVAANEGFYKYDGVSTVRYDYPVRDGVGLTISHLFGGTNIDTWTIEEKKALPVLNSVVYLNLQSPTEGYPRYLYQFDDGAITPSPISEETLSNAVVFQNRLYMMVRAEDGATLLSFDGSTVRVIFSSPEHNDDDLLALYATDQYLYIANHHFNMPGGSLTDVNIKRFDGAAFIDIPQFDLPYSYVREVHQQPGTETVYFHSENDITKFDGSAVTQIVEETLVDFFSFVDFENVIYFVKMDGTGAFTFQYYDGASVGVVALPVGFTIGRMSNQLLVYEGELYVSVLSASGTGAIYRYDGTSFFPFFDVSGALFEREGKLLIQSNGLSYEYYRGAFCTINSGSGYKARLNLSTNAFHLWWKNVVTGDSRYVQYGAERKTGCGGDDDTPDPGYERIDISLLGAGIDDYCGLGISWPPPPPPFPDRWWQVSLTDTKGTKVFQEKFNKPSEFSLPLSAKQSYDLSLDVLNKTTQSFENVITIDKELVPLGLSDLSLSMEPKNGKVFLKALTNNGKELPFQMTLFNQKGIAIWQEIFIAPLSKEITDGVEVGASLRLSSIPMQPMEVKVNYYPNPFAGKITVEFDTEKETPVYVAIYSLQGELVHQEMLSKAPGKHTIELGSKNKEGLYILSVTTGNKELRELIELKYK